MMEKQAELFSVKREVVGYSNSPLSIEQKMEALARLEEQCKSCKACTLCANGGPVMHDGNVMAPIMIVSEAPDKAEVETGRPFAALAGEVLDRMLRAAGMGRRDIYLCNVLKGFPGPERIMRTSDIKKCLHFFDEQLEVVAPRVVCAMGSVATKALCGNISLKDNHGKIYTYKGWPVVPTYHIAFTYREQDRAEQRHIKRMIWDDFLVVTKLSKELKPGIISTRRFS